MKTTIATLALALTSTNAASLRTRTGLSRSDTSLVKALATKYDCNTAGNTLVETLKEINIKHDGTRTKLTKTCADNTAANALAETTASGIKDTCLADYQDDPVAKYTLALYGSTTSVATAFTEGGFEGTKAAVHHTQDGLVSSATTAETDATQPSDDADSAFTEAEGVYNGALNTRKELMDKFAAARPAAENAIGNVWGTSGTEIMSAHDAKSKEYERGTAARATAEGECGNIFDKRMEGINADDALVDEIRKLVNDLSDCDVPATTDATTIDGSFIEMKAQAKCAVAQEKATVFLQERLHVDVDGVADISTINENFGAYVNRITLETSHVKAEKGKCYDAAVKLETDAKALADTEFGELTLSIATELKSQTDALNKAGTDLDTTTASAVSDAKTPWETTQKKKTRLNKVLADATAAKITAVGSADVDKKLADADFDEANEAALAIQTNAITTAKESCDGAWKIAQALKTTNDKANKESCEIELNFLDEEKTMINAMNVKVEDLLHKLKDSQKDYKTDECNESTPGNKENGYRGCQTKTKNGRTCQKWTSQFHKHTRTPENPEFAGKGIGDHNYCRNPDGEPHGIWCYTTDPKKRWEYCDPLPITDESSVTANEAGPKENIELSGGNDGNAKNLQACIGECDNDGQCAAGLECYQRSHGEAIPGCTGSGQEKNWDYCYDPVGRIELSGGNDSNAKNLQACIGECDNDGQCAAGLKCFQRTNGETIPGCKGSGAEKDWDYCYNPLEQS